MARLLVQHDEDPGICVVMEQAPNTTWYGDCTECGESVEGGTQEWAVSKAKKHVDRHESRL